MRSYANNYIFELSKSEPLSFLITIYCIDPELVMSKRKTVMKNLLSLATCISNLLGDSELNEFDQEKDNKHLH